MSKKQHGGRKGGKRHGRNKKFCERYRLEGRWEKNKRLKQARHLKRVKRKQAQQEKRAEAA